MRKNQIDWIKYLNLDRRCNHELMIYAILNDLQKWIDKPIKAKTYTHTEYTRNRISEKKKWQYKNDENKLYAMYSFDADFNEYKKRKKCKKSG